MRRSTSYFQNQPIKSFIRTNEFNWQDIYKVVIVSVVACSQFNSSYEDVSEDNSNISTETKLNCFIKIFISTSI
jgi:hypothetical protein